MKYLGFIVLLSILVFAVWWRWLSPQSQEELVDEAHKSQSQTLVSAIQPIGENNLVLEPTDSTETEVKVEIVPEETGSEQAQGQLKDETNNEAEEEGREPIAEPIETIVENEVIEETEIKSEAEVDQQPPKTDFELADEADLLTAIRAIQSGDTSSGVRLLTDLNQRSPKLLAPYINLASVKASTGELESARQILSQGLNANPNNATLFTNLQSVHEALAAHSYKLALGEVKFGSPMPKINIPLLTNLHGASEVGQIDENPPSTQSN